MGISNEDIRCAYHTELWWGSLMKSIYLEEQEGNNCYYCTEAMERSPLHVSLKLLYSPPLYFSIFHSTCLCILFAGMSVALKLTSSEYFGLLSISHKGLRGMQQ
jgi:hypothetical protein